MTNGAGRESIVGLARHLVRSAIDLGKLEFQSARQELGEGLGILGAGAILLVIAVVLALLALIALVVLIISLVALVLPLWLSALIVMLVFLLLVGLFVWLGVRRLMSARDRLTIPDTRASVQEDLAWAKRLLRREER
jgi:uncharacterized membrane protein YqjE